MLPQCGVSTAQIWQGCIAGNLPNVITHAKCQINLYKIVTLAKV